MNKLFIAISTAVVMCSVNVASAQMGGTGSSAIGATGNANELKKDPAVSGANPGMDMDHGKGMHKGKMDMKAMDTNMDGMITKEEYMTHQEMMYDGMKKNKSGTVDMKDMGMMKGK